MKIAIIPGSFDPATFGHVDVIYRASKIFDKVYPVILVNAEKTGMFTPEERLKILTSACRNIKNVECSLFEGLTSDFAKNVGAGFIVKGARNAIDFEYEMGLSQIMKKFDERLETVILPSSPVLSYVSSTYAREKIRHFCDISDIADETTANLIMNIRSDNR